MRRWTRVSRCLLVSLLPAACLAQEAAGTTMVRHVLPSAVCADQSPGHFYMAANESSSDFVVYLQGGQGCAHNQSICEDLLVDKPHLFTSGGFLDTIEAHSFLSGNGQDNPLYSTFNRVYVPYCTMDMYLLDTESSDGRLQFRGRQLLEETLRTVLDTAENDATVIFGGSSAGGVGAFNAASWLLDTFDQVTELSVILDSAFFFDVQGYLKPLLEYAQKYPSVAYASHCAEEFDGGPCCVQFGCMLQRGYYPSTSGRMRGTFVLSSSQDINAGVQIDVIGTYEEKAPEMLWGVAAYTGQTRLTLRNLASLFPEALSVFSPSCIEHVILITSELDMAQCVPGMEVATDTEFEYACIYGANGRAQGSRCDVTLGVGIRWQAVQSVHTWKTLQVDNTSVRHAMELWWEGRGHASNQVRLLDSCDDPHCNPSCQGGLLPGGRKETDSFFSWALVLTTLAFAVIILGTGISATVWRCIQWNRVERIVADRLSQKALRKEGVRNVASTTLSAESRWVLLAKPLTRQDEVCGGDGTKTPVLEWRGLSYWLPQKTRGCLPSRWAVNEVGPQTEKQLIFSVDGAVPAGALCALMGPSGSGKSTLLDLLTGRGTVGRCRGDIIFEGTSIANQQAAYIRNAGYMRQTNIGFLAGLSVFDNLVYASMIRLPGTLEAKLSRVHSVMEETALELVQKTKAGSLSGGQKRRLMLALELLADRRLLFLDEPTSGVDATAALELMTILRRLSDKVTIIVAIHQPRPEIWQLFSHTILVKSGRVVYCGSSVNALNDTSRYLPRPIKEPIFADQMGAHGRLAFIGESVQPRFCGAPGESEMGTTSTSDMTAGASSSDVKAVSRDQDKTDSRISVLRSVLSRAAGFLKFGRRDSGQTSLHEDFNHSTRGLAMKIGPKIHNPLYVEPALNTEVAAVADNGVTVPDKILDLLARINCKDIDRTRALQANLNARNMSSQYSKAGVCGYTSPHDKSNQLEGTEEGRKMQTPTTAPCAEMIANASCSSGAASSQEITPSTSAASRSPAKHNEDMTSDKSARSANERATCTPAWKISATLLARSVKSGYGMQAVWNVGTLVGTMTLMAVAFRAATHDSEMLHLMVSVLFSMVLPVIVVYHPLMIENSWEEWPLTKTEIADGFYQPVCVTMRIVIDHLAVGVLVSFATVGIMHSILWHRLISELPASELGVNIQLSCGVTLIAWVMISMFDAIAISGLHLTTAFSVGVSLTSVWVFFSGTVLLISSIPDVLRALTYTSPHYWISSFMLRVILDGLNTTGNCDHNNSFYCAKGFGDLFADALGLHTRPNAYNILAVVIFTFFAFSVMVITVERKGRHTGILGGLDAPSSVLAEGMQDSSGVDKITRIDCRCDYSETTFTIRSQGSARVLDLSSTT